MSDNFKGIIPLAKEAIENVEKEYQKDKPKFSKVLIFGTSGGDSATAKNFDILCNSNDEFKLNKDNLYYIQQQIYKSIMENQEQQQTEGQKRVRVSFNSNALKRVGDFKQKMADAIDALNDVATSVKESPKELVNPDDFGDFMREVSTAKTQLQIASMCGVAALTHDMAFKYLPND